MSQLAARLRKAPAFDFAGGSDPVGAVLAQGNIAWLKVGRRKWASRFHRVTIMTRDGLRVHVTAPKVAT